MLTRTLPGGGVISAEYDQMEELAEKQPDAYSFILNLEKGNNEWEDLVN